MRFLALLLLLTLAVGAQERQKDEKRILELVQQNQFAELDKLAADWKGQKYPSGRSKSHLLYTTLKQAVDKTQAEAWREANSDSVAARILTGDVERLKEPFVYVLKLESATTPKDQEAALEEALKLDRSYLEATQIHARQLKGKALAEFADKATGTKIGEGMYAIVYSAFVDQFGTAAFRQSETVFDRDRIIAGYQELLKQFADNPYYLSLYTKAAAGWEDKPRAAELGKRLGSYRDPDVWTPRQWEGFQKWLASYQP